MLAGQRISNAVAVGYGPGPLVTPVAGALLGRLPAEGINLREFLRAEQGRYWSYLCASPACCPADGIPFDETTDPAAVAMTVAGQVALPDRAALAATIAPAAKSIRTAARRAENRARQLITTATDSQTARRLLATEGRSAVAEAIAAYRDGGTITSDDQIAWLALTLRSLPVRDDAWARMDPARQRHAQDGCVSAACSPSRRTRSAGGTRRAPLRWTGST